MSVKISQTPNNPSPAAADYLLGDQASGGPTTKNYKLSDLASFMWALANIPAGATSPITRDSEGMTPYIASGLVWTGDAYASTRNASMTAGVAYINGRRISIAAVTARTFLASDDTYVDLLDNGDGTVTLVYTAVVNNAASPALAANSLRIAKIVAGASSIAAASSIIQTGMDSLYNLIGNTAPIANKNINFMAAATVMNSPSNSNFTAETSVQTVTHNQPAGCKHILILGSIRLQAQNASSQDIRARIRIDSGASFSFQPFFTSEATFSSANISLLDYMTLAPGTHTLDLMGSTGGSANIGASNIFIIPLP